jgi:5'-3' exonuclease
MATGTTLLIDAASLIYRALFSVPDTMRAPDGTLVNAAYGFISMLTRLIEDHDPEFICCAADDDWRPEWRVNLIPEYKAMRAEEGSAQEEAEDKLEPQMPIIAAVLADSGIPTVGHAGYEAEDVIGTLAERAPGPVGIVSGDRDLFQLVRDPNIYILYPKRGVSELDIVNEAFIEAKYNIPGRAYRDFAVLRGDPSDGLPGVKGIGEKLASGLIRTHGSLAGVIEAAETSPNPSVPLGKVKRDLDYVKRALEVVTIPTDLPIPEVDLTRPRKEPDPALYELGAGFGLEGATRRLGAALASSSGS